MSGDIERLRVVELTAKSPDAVNVWGIGSLQKYRCAVHFLAGAVQFDDGLTY